MELTTEDAKAFFALGRPVTGKREWFIRKNGYFYRPNRSGYTQEPIAAGLFTEAEAKAEASVENTITAHHACEFAPEICHMRALAQRFDFIDAEDSKV